MNCTSYGSALRPNALPQSASGLIRWNGVISSSGSRATVRIHTVVAPGVVVLARWVADLDRAAEAGLVVGDASRWGTLPGVLSARRGVTASLLSRRASNSGVAATATCMPVAVARTLPSPSTSEAARVGGGAPAA